MSSTGDSCGEAVISLLNRNERHFFLLKGKRQHNVPVSNTERNRSRCPTRPSVRRRPSTRHLCTLAATPRRALPSPHVTCHPARPRTRKWGRCYLMGGAAPHIFQNVCIRPLPMILYEFELCCTLYLFCRFLFRPNNTFYKNNNLIY